MYLLGWGNRLGADNPGAVGESWQCDLIRLWLNISDLFWNLSAVFKYVLYLIFAAKCCCSFSIFSLILLPKNRTLHFIGRKMVISKWWSLIMLSNKIIHQQTFVCVVMFFLPCMLECHLCYFETAASTLTALQMTALVKALRRWSTDICLINTGPPDSLPTTALLLSTQNLPVAFDFWLCLQWGILGKWEDN